jgi:D-alanyl-D-alanine dipeptidase
MNETVCPRCGKLHHAGTGFCPEVSLAGRTLPNGLQVVKRLGGVPLGELYRAQYLDSHVEVELLVIPPGSRGSEAAAEADDLAHLRDQLHRSARIKHPNVASVCDVGETEEGALWAAFEVLQGQLLSETLSAGDVLPQYKSIGLVLQAASGLQAAHEVGLVHGDLSPDSILVTSSADNRPLVKLIRFRSIQHGGTRSAGDGERTQYTAPELLTGHSPDERSDVFGLGAVLHHLLTGPPPGAEWDVVPAVPEAVLRVIAKALEPAPDDRFQTVAAFARALTTATTKPHARLGKGARRPGRLRWLRGVLAVAALAAIAVALLGTGSSRLGDGGDEPVTTGEIRVLPSDSLDATPSDRPDDGAASDSMLVDVRSVDSTIQVDLRYATARNFTGAPLPGYEARRALLRREAAAALGRVQARLRSKGLGLRVFDAYRPVRASRAMVDWAERTGKKGLLQSGHIAERSRHNLGGAVDLTMVDLATGTEASMGSSFDNFTASGAQTADVSRESLRARQILVEAMESEGFRPYGGAWWHFNYPLEGAVPLDWVIR